MFEAGFITSRRNEKILEATALRERKVRKEKGLFYFEGKKLFEEAVARGVPLVTLFIREDVTLCDRQTSALPADCSVFRVSESVYDKLSEEKSPEGLFCIAKTIDKYHKFATIYNSRDFSDRSRATVLAAASVRDPGNLGTLLRSAAAFGADGVILTSDCADLYSPKTVRASMGAMFDLPVTVVSDPIGTVEALKENGWKVYGSALDRGAVALPSLPAGGRCCFFVGNEGHGLDGELLEACSGKVFIPMTDKAESLNVSAAAAVLLYSRYTAPRG